MPFPKAILNVLTSSEVCSFIFIITTAGAVPCGGPKMSAFISSIVQIIFFFRSFEISKNIQC